MLRGRCEKHRERAENARQQIWNGDAEPVIQRSGVQEHRSLSPLRTDAGEGWDEQERGQRDLEIDVQEHQAVAAVEIEGREKWNAVFTREQRQHAGVSHQNHERERQRHAGEI